MHNLLTSLLYAGYVTAEIQGISSCPSISFAADPLCWALLIRQQLSLIQLKVHGKQISKPMVASLYKSSLSIPEEKEPVPGVILLSPGLGTVNHEQHHPLSSEQLHSRYITPKVKPCEQGRGKVCSSKGKQEQ